MKRFFKIAVLPALVLAAMVMAAPREAKAHGPHFKHHRGGHPAYHRHYRPLPVPHHRHPAYYRHPGPVFVQPFPGPYRVMPHPYPVRRPGFSIGIGFGY